MYSHEENEGSIKLNILEVLDIMVAQGWKTLACQGIIHRHFVENNASKNKRVNITQT